MSILRCSTGTASTSHILVWFVGKQEKMSNSAEFLKAAEDVKKLTTSPNNDELLELYGLFKQATVGDCDTTRPGLFDPKGKAKWDAWNGRKGLSKEDAEKQYIEVAQRLIAQYS